MTDQAISNEAVADDTSPLTLEPLTPEQVTNAARDIVTNVCMIADLSESDWQASLALMLSGLARYSNLGMILVPFAPHQHMFWLNGRVPGTTVRCNPIARESVQDVARAINEMTMALGLQGDPDAEAFFAYVDECEAENLEHLPYSMWKLDKPKGPLG